MMLHQFLQPLCRNGIEFSENGGVYLMSKLIALTENMAVIGFTVNDTGVGIRKELHDKLFSHVLKEFRKAFIVVRPCDYNCLMEQSM